MKARVFGMFLGTMIAIGFSPSTASALTVTSPLNFGDAELKQLRNDGLFSELFVAEGRIGNNANNGTYEASINNAAGSPVEQTNFSWGNGVATNSNNVRSFSLEYDGQTVKFIIAGKTLQTQVFSGPVNQIFLRTRAANNSAARLSNLMLNNTPVGSLFSQGTGGSHDVDYLVISGDLVNGAYSNFSPFNLTGNALLSWTGTQPKNSHLAFQIKVGTGTPVPTPALLPGLIGMGVAAMRKKRSEEQETIETEA